MEKESQLKIILIDAGRDEVEKHAGAIDSELAGKAKVDVSDEKAPDMAGRGVDPGMIIPAINILLVGTQTYFMLAAYLERNKSKTMIVINPDTGEKMTITESDTLKAVQEKLARVLKKKSFWSRLFNKKHAPDK